jgi:hypothetical protein
MGNGKLQKKQKLSLCRMYRIVLITLVFVVSIYSAFAQLNKKEYKQLIDYVNCKYAIAYISEKSNEIAKEKGGKLYLQDFNKRKDTFEKGVTNLSDINKGIDKTQSKSTSIYEAIKNSANGWGKANVLWKYIDDKKKVYNIKWTSEEAINSAVSLSDDDIKISGKPVNFKSFLRITTSELRAELPAMLTGENTDSNEMESDSEDGGEGEQTHVQVSISNDKIEPVTSGTSNEDIEEDEQLITNKALKQEEQKEMRTKYLLFNSSFLLVIVILVVIVLTYFNRGRILLYLKKLFTENKFNSRSELVALLKQNDELKDTLNDIKKRIQNLEREKAELNNKLNEIEHQLNPLKPQIISPPDKTQQINYMPLIVEPRPTTEKLNPVEPKQLFADAIINSEFHRITEQPNSDTVYELRLFNSLKKATFIVFVGAYQRVIKNADFVDGCDKQKLASPSQNIEVENGIAELNDSGKWRITKKATVKFI